MGRPHWWLLLAVLGLFWAQSCHSKDVPCKLNSLGQCPPDETCEQIDSSDATKGLCLCVSGKPRGSSGTCSEPAIAVPSTTVPPPQATSSTPWGWLIAGFVLAVLVAGLMLAARRFRWLAKLQARRAGRYAGVDFDQEDDDPPLA